MYQYYLNQADEYIRRYGCNADYDQFRNQFGVCADSVLIFTAWTDAYAEIYG